MSIDSRCKLVLLAWLIVFAASAIAAKLVEVGLISQDLELMTFSLTFISGWGVLNSGFCLMLCRDSYTHIARCFVISSIVISSAFVLFGSYRRIFLGLAIASNQVMWVTAALVAMWVVAYVIDHLRTQN